MRKPIMLGVAGSVVAVTAGWFLLLSPQMDETATIRVETADRQVTNDANAAQIPVLQARLADMSEDVEMLRAMSRQVPPNVDLDTFYLQIAEAASLAGVTVTNTTVSAPALIGANTRQQAPAEENTDAGTAPAQAPVVQAVLASYRVTMQVSATPHGGVAFLAALEGMERLSVVGSTNLTVGRDGEPGTMTVTATFYLQQVDVDGLAEQIENLAAGEHTQGQRPGPVEPDETLPAADPADTELTNDEPAEAGLPEDLPADEPTY